MTSFRTLVRAVLSAVVSAVVLGGAPRVSLAQDKSEPASTETTVTVELQPPDAGKTGAKGLLIAVVSPLGEHTVAGPCSWSLSKPGPEGFTFQPPILKCPEARFPDKEAKFEVPFVAVRAGKTTVAGTLHFSVCGEGGCIRDKVMIEVPVEVE